MKYDGLVRATVIARRLHVSPRTVRRWIERGYIEGMKQRRSYWVMIRGGRLIVIDNSRIQIGVLDVM